MHPYIFDDKEKACNLTFFIWRHFWRQFVFPKQLIFASYDSQTSSHTYPVEVAVEKNYTILSVRQLTIFFCDPPWSQKSPHSLRIV